MKYTGIKNLIFYRANGIDSTTLELKLNAQDLTALQGAISAETEEREHADADSRQALNNKLIDGLQATVTAANGNAKIEYTLLGGV